MSSTNCMCSELLLQSGTSVTHCREFAQLVEANAIAQLPESEFEVDPGLRDMVEAQIKQEEEAVRQVCFMLPSPCFWIPLQVACASDSAYFDMWLSVEPSPCSNFHALLHHLSMCRSLHGKVRRRG